VTADLYLSLSNSSENIAVVREALWGVAQALSLDALDADDLDTAVTEACKNVVWHAYEGADGPLELELYLSAGAVHAVVRDHGIGIRPHLGERTQPHTGIGLPIVHMRAHRVIYTNLDEGGTELRIELITPSAASVPALSPEPPPPLSLGDGAPHTIELALAGDDLAATVLPRVLRTLGARARFSEDALAALERFALSLARGARDSIGAEHLVTAVDAAPHNLDLRVGWLREGAGESLLEALRAELGDSPLGLSASRCSGGSQSGERYAMRLREET
jgi:anti-sigma regulatory factor (Ser/Thr protein kinase)